LDSVPITDDEERPNAEVLAHGYLDSKFIVRHIGECVLHFHSEALALMLDDEIKIMV
jgi:hypothetical protein